MFSHFYSRVCVYVWALTHKSLIIHPLCALIVWILEHGEQDFPRGGGKYPLIREILRWVQHTTRGIILLWRNWCNMAHTRPTIILLATKTNKSRVCTFEQTSVVYESIIIIIFGDKFLNTHNMQCKASFISKCDNRKYTAKTKENYQLYEEFFKINNNYDFVIGLSVVFRRVLSVIAFTSERRLKLSVVILL